MPGGHAGPGCQGDRQSQLRTHTHTMYAKLGCVRLMFCWTMHTCVRLACEAAPYYLARACPVGAFTCNVQHILCLLLNTCTSFPLKSRKKTSIRCAFYSFPSFACRLFLLSGCVSVRLESCMPTFAFACAHLAFACVRKMQRMTRTTG